MQTTNNSRPDQDPMVIVYAVAVGMVIGVFFMLAGMLWGRL